VYIAQQIEQLDKDAVPQERTNATAPTAADRSNGVYDEIFDEYDKIDPYVELANEEHNVSETTAAGYDHLNERSTAYSKPYEQLIDQQADDKSAENQEKNDSLLIELYAKFSEADGTKTQLPDFATPLTERPILKNLHAQVNKKDDKLDVIELANKPDASATAIRLELAGHNAEKPYVGLDTSERKDDSSAVREYTSLTSRVNSPNATINADSLAKDPLTQEGQRYETLAPDKMETFNRSAPTSSYAYERLARNNGREFIGLDSLQRDAEIHATLDYTSLKVDSQNATQASEKCEPSPYTRLTNDSYEALNQYELVKPDKAMTSAYTPLTATVEKEYQRLDSSQIVESGKPRDYTSLNRCCENSASESESCSRVPALLLTK
jgi:hypothetical protein